MRRSQRWLAALLCSITAAQATAQRPTSNPFEVPASVPSPRVSGSYSFVALGHLRGDAKGPNAKLPEVVAEVRALRPSFIVLTGDAIWGDIDATPIDPASLHRQWG